MTLSTIAGGSSQGGVKIPCILYEGVATVTATGIGSDGYSDSVLTYAAPLAKDQWVSLSADTANTYAATYGLPVVIPVAASSGIIGKIITEPSKPLVMPASTPTGTWVAHLAGKYFRVATVWFPGLTAVTKAEFQGVGAANVVPGLLGTITVDASLTIAAGATTRPETLVVSDCANGGLGVIPLHYAGSGTANVSMLVGFSGGINLIGA